MSTIVPFLIQIGYWALGHGTCSPTRTMRGFCDTAPSSHRPLAANVQRRSLSSSQKYMIMEQARRLNGARKVEIVTSEGERQQLTWAATVLDYAPGQAAQVLAHRSVADASGQASVPADVVPARGYASY